MVLVNRKSMLLIVVVSVASSVQSCGVQPPIEKRVSAQMVARVVHSRDDRTKHYFSERDDIREGKFIFDNQRHFRPGDPDLLPVNCDEDYFGVWYMLIVKPWKHFTHRLQIEYRWTKEKQNGDVLSNSKYHSEYFHHGSSKQSFSAHELRSTAYRLRFIGHSLFDEPREDGVYRLAVLHREDVLLQSRFDVSGCQH